MTKVTYKTEQLFGRLLTVSEGESAALLVGGLEAAGRKAGRHGAGAAVEN